MEKFVPFFLLGCTACFVETSNAELGFVVDPGWSDNELLDRLLADEPEAPWPERPWLNATLSRTGTVDGAVTLGIKGGAFGVSAGLTQAITFEKGHATRAIFVATQTDTQQTLTNVDPETGASGQMPGAERMRLSIDGDAEVDIDGAVIFADEAKATEAKGQIDQQMGMASMVLGEASKKIKIGQSSTAVTITATFNEADVEQITKSIQNAMKMMGGGM